MIAWQFSLKAGMVKRGVAAMNIIFCEKHIKKFHLNMKIFHIFLVNNLYLFQ